MVARGPMRTPCALFILVVLLVAAGPAIAWDKPYRFPIKVRVSGAETPDAGIGGIRSRSQTAYRDWELAAGQSRREILCPKRGYSFAVGMQPFFSTLSGSAKAASRGGEGTYMSFHGHLRLPVEKTLWDFYGDFRMWDKISARVQYASWQWGGPGHARTDGNFAGLLINQDDKISSQLNLTMLTAGADYEVSFGRDVVFGPNADLNIIKWSQTVSKDGGASADFAQTILQPAIGAHVRYEPSNTGYFSWFKPYLEGRFTWMNFNGLGLSTWDMAAGIAPPASRNVDAGLKLGYKQWKLDGNRNRLFVDMAVEGPYLDFALHF